MRRSEDVTTDWQSSDLGTQIEAIGSKLLKTPLTPTYAFGIANYLASVARDITRASITQAITEQSELTRNSGLKNSTVTSSAPPATTTNPGTS